MTPELALRDNLIVVAGPAEDLGRACAEFLAAQGARVVGDIATADGERIDAIVVTSAADLGDVGAAVTVTTAAARAAFDALVAQDHGRLVLVASGPAFPIPGAPSLSVVNGALFGLVRALAAEAQGSVNVNAVAPVLDTPATAAFFDAHPYLDRELFGSDAVARVVAFLCHESCDLRGAIVTAGGGRIARVGIVTAAGVLAPEAGVDDVAAAIDQICSLERAIEPRTVLDELLFVDV